MNTQAPANGGCLSELRLDRWVAAEVSSAERAEIEAHVRTCLRCSTRRTAREAEQRLFQETAPPLATEGRRRVAAPPAPVSRGRSSKRRAVGATAALVTALAAGFLIVPALQRQSVDETVTPKGQQPRLRFFVLDGAAGTVREGKPRERVYPGDQIRFSFDGDALRGRRVAVLGRDGAGKVSVFFPHGGAQAIAPPAGDGLTPYSIKLDDTPGPETLYALYCPDAIALGPLQTALAGGAPPDWPAVCQVETVLLDKSRR